MSLVSIKGTRIIGSIEADEKIVLLIWKTDLLIFFEMYFIPVFVQSNRNNIRDEELILAIR